MANKSKVKVKVTPNKSQKGGSADGEVKVKSKVETVKKIPKLGSAHRGGGIFYDAVVSLKNKNK